MTCLERRIMLIILEPVLPKPRVRWAEELCSAPRRQCAIDSERGPINVRTPSIHRDRRRLSFVWVACARGGASATDRLFPHSDMTVGGSGTGLIGIQWLEALPPVGTCVARSDLRIGECRLRHKAGTPFASSLKPMQPPSLSIVMIQRMVNIFLREAGGGARHDDGRA